MVFPLEFTVEGPPVSQQSSSRSRQRWRERVRAAAKPHWQEDEPLPGPVTIRITYLYVTDMLDVDNIPKPILDALNGLVYADDSQVTDLISRKRAVRDMPGFSGTPDSLIGYLGGETPVVHIVAEASQTQEGTFW